MQENSQLHMEIIKLKESGKFDDTGLRNELRILKSQNDDLQFLATQKDHR